MSPIASNLELARSLGVLLAGGVLILMTTGLLAADNSAGVMQLARSKGAEQAADILKPVVDRNPDDLLLQADYLAVLHWSGQSDIAWARRHLVDHPDAPKTVYATLGRVAREVGAFHAATRYFAKAIDNAPNDSSLRAARVMAMVDAGQFVSAMKALETDEARMGQRSELMFARGYLAEGQGHYIAAATAYRDCFVTDGANDVAYTRFIGALSKIGGLSGANLIQDQRDELIALRDWWLTVVNRNETGTDPSDARTYAATDLSIAKLEATVSAANRNGIEWQPLKLYSEFDLVTAYRDRMLMARSTALYQSLVNRAIRPPRYSVLAAADAHVHLRQPETARELYQRVIDSDLHPDIVPYAGRFHALLASGDTARAIDQMNELVLGLPARMVDQDGSIVDNAARVDAEMYAAIGRARLGDLSAAESRLGELVARRPKNGELRAHYANVKQLRGHPRAARDEADAGIAAAGDHRGLQTALANALIDVHDYTRAEPLIHQLAQIYPDHNDVLQLQRRWKSANGPEVSVYFTADDGAQAVVGESAHTLRTRVYSKKLANRYRLFVDLGDRVGNFDSGRSAYQTASVGAEYRQPVLLLDGGVGANRYGPNKDLDKGSGFATAQIFVDDRNTISAEVQTFDRDTPLRALQQDVAAGSITLAATRREDETSEAAAAVKYLDFEDDNGRALVDARWRRRWWSRSRFELSTQLAAQYEHNSSPTQQYFSPADASEAKITLHNRWHSFARNDTTMQQILAVDLGAYWQDGFGSDAITGARYEHRWRIKPAFELVYGVSHVRRPYDGRRENETSAYGYLRWTPSQ